MRPHSQRLRHCGLTFSGSSFLITTLMYICGLWFELFFSRKYISDHLLRANCLYRFTNPDFFLILADEVYLQIVLGEPDTQAVFF